MRLVLKPLLKHRLRFGQPGVTSSLGRAASHLWAVWHRIPRGYTCCCWGLRARPSQAALSPRAPSPYLGEGVPQRRPDVRASLSEPAQCQNQAGLSFSLLLPTGTESLLPAPSSWQKAGGGERARRGQGVPAAPAPPCWEGAVAARAIFNLFLLPAGSRVPPSFLPSLCPCLSLQLLPATVRCVNYIWPGKSAARQYF